MARAVKTDDLPDCSSAYNAPFLRCRKCNARYSAHKGDYSFWRANKPFKCCGVNMQLMNATVVLTEVR